MQHRPHSAETEEWVVWNGSAGILLTAALGRVECGAAGRTAWLARPFEMVGPFDLDALEHSGRIHFAACIVMSRQRWQSDQDTLRREAFAQRRAAQARSNAEYGYWGGQTAEDRQSHTEERAHRAALGLLAEDRLEASVIKAAFRKRAQKAHPDAGGSHDAFVRLSAARDALLARFA
jgi:hypothetical protein